MDSVVKLLEQQVIEADSAGGAESDVSTERIENMRRYRGEKYGDEISGRSEHISMDVWDSIESTKGLFDKAFNGARKFFRFKPAYKGDRGDKAATDYVYRQFFTENKGASIIRDALHDALVSKRAIVSVDWRANVHQVGQRVLPIQGLDQNSLGAVVAEIQQMNARDPSKRIDVQLTEQGLVLTQLIDKSFSEIKVIQPERFFRDPEATYISTSMFAGEYDILSKNELEVLGFDPEEVANLNLDYRFGKTEESTARRSVGASSTLAGGRRSGGSQLVTLWMTVAVMNLAEFAREHGLEDDEDYQDVPDAPMFHRFYWSKGKMLTNPRTGKKYEPLTRMPYHEWTQYKISHTEYGMCDADVLKSTQRTKTTMTRLAVDNQGQANNPKWIARANAILNPRELLEGRIGGVLWSKTDVNAAIVPVTPTMMSPAFPLVMELLEQEKENRTGLSRLAKGVNNDAVSNQNASNMIERLTNLSLGRVSRSIRSFRDEFLVPILLDAYNLGVQNDRRMYTIENRGGQWITYTPSELEERSTYKTAVALTDEEAGRAAATLLALSQAMAADPQMALVYSAKEKAALYSEVFELVGYEDASRFLCDIESPEFAARQKQAAIQANQQAMIQLQTTQAQLMILQDEQRRKWTETETNKAKLSVEVTKQAVEHGLEEDKFIHEKKMDKEKITIEKQRLAKK